MAFTRVFALVGGHKYPPAQCVLLDPGPKIGVYQQGVDQLALFPEPDGDGDFVYVGTRCGQIKIGTSHDPGRRARQLGLTLLRVMPGDRRLERELHNRFRRARIDREWFMPTADLLARLAGDAPRGRDAVKVLLEGPPRIGKTTAMVRLVALLREYGQRVGGFITREIRIDGRRVGFEVDDLEGHTEVIAHEDLGTGVMVGRYHVDVPAFERVGVPAVRHAHDRAGVVIIDEIGRMELASSSFLDAVNEAMTSPRPVVATIHAHSHKFTDRLKASPSVELITVDERNRDGLPDRLLRALTASLD